MNQNSISGTRILSLDIFRGITVAAMILVNNPGNWGKIYWPLKHADWHGLTPTDLIFPFFLFIMGVSIVYAFNNKKELPQNKLWIKIVKRTLILFGLGLFLNLFPDFNFEKVRIMGVLQRISIVYAVCGLLHLYTSRSTQIICFIFVLIGYYIIMNVVPVPDFGLPNLDKATNMAAWVDRLILTTNHTWKFSITWDPEGILSTFPAICTGLSGIFVGEVLLNKILSNHLKFKILFLSAAIFIALAIVLNPIFPINKSLWTSTYVLITSGFAILLYIALYYYIDIKKYRFFSTVFLVFGLNAITVFFGSTLIAKICNIKFISTKDNILGIKDWLYQFYIAPFFTSAFLASLVGALIFVFIWYVILKILYRYKIFIKV